MTNPNESSPEGNRRESGWGFPGLSKRFHYFENGISLCGKWMYRGQLEPDTGTQGKEDCKECYRRLERRKESK